jgi:transcriptional regulator GlxA family with amidase domain
MTNTPYFLPTMQGERLVLFLAYEDVGLLDLTGPQTVFWAADKRMRERGLPGYARRVASLAGGMVRSAEGMVLASEALSSFLLQDIDTIIVPGSPDMPRVQSLLRELSDWLAVAAQRARRTASVCSGTFLLAQAGLLNGKRAATHWAMCELLQERFPAVDIGKRLRAPGGDAGGARTGGLPQASRRPGAVQRIAAGAGGRRRHVRAPAPVDHG